MRLYKILFLLFFVNICFSQNQIYTIKYPVVRFGMFEPTVLSSDQENDTYIRTDDGLFTGAFIEEYVFDKTSNTWILVVSSGVITNSILSSGNTITSTVNGISDATTLINSNVLTYVSDSLTSIINGISSNKVKITSGSGGGLTFRQALTIVNLRL